MALSLSDIKEISFGSAVYKALSINGTQVWTGEPDPMYLVKAGALQSGITYTALAAANYDTYFKFSSGANQTAVIESASSTMKHGQGAQSYADYQGEAVFSKVDATDYTTLHIKARYFGYDAGNTAVPKGKVIVKKSGATITSEPASTAAKSVSKTLTGSYVEWTLDISGLAADVKKNMVIGTFAYHKRYASTYAVGGMQFTDLWMT